jgi:hypothetical protein
MKDVFYGLLLLLTLLIYLVVVCPLMAFYRMLVLKKAKPEKKPSILYFSSVQWFEVWQRPQHCVVRVKDKYHVFYISPLPMHHILKDIKGWLRKRIYVHSKDLVIYSPILFTGENNFHFIRMLNRILIIGYMTELYVRFKISYPILWMNNPFYAYLIDNLPHRMVVFDIMDEYTKFNIKMQK